VSRQAQRTPIPLGPCIFTATCPHFFSKDPATPKLYTLSLHDALPILICDGASPRTTVMAISTGNSPVPGRKQRVSMREMPVSWRSEEHTSELQSRSDLVCRLLLEKKKN